MYYIGKTRSPLSVILLSIVTCGIYAIYWYYATMEDINRLYDEQQMKSGMLLILSILCPPVIFYIYYMFDKCLKQVSVRENIEYDGGLILWLLLSLLAGVGWFVAIWQTQSTLNRIWMKREAFTQNL
jgi:TRAP-type mannitol/chloroaromatic compound transport system permease small subunit